MLTLERGAPFVGKIRPVGVAEALQMLENTLLAQLVRKVLVDRSRLRFSAAPTTNNQTANSLPLDVASILRLEQERNRI